LYRSFDLLSNWQEERGAAKKNMEVELAKIRNRVLPLLAATLLVLLLAGVWLAPAEARLGNLVKLVYVHGALVWTGLLTFSLAGLLGLLALGTRRPAWYRGSAAAGLAALVVWIVYVISAMLVTGLTWGQVIAWNEPRVQATALILGAAVLVAVVARLVGDERFTAVVNLLMGIVPWIVVRQAGVIRHPVDPIGSSESTAIQGFYLLIVLTVAGLAAVLVAWLWTGAEQKAGQETLLPVDPPGQTPGPG
jgi:hypothetical protein